MRTIAMAALGLAAGCSLAATLEVQEKIPLPGCKGRIDHLAFDVQRRRLFIAELGNNSVAVIDLGAHRLAHRIEGLNQPQGIAWFEPLQRLYVASGGDGTVRAFDGRDFRQVKNIRLGDDADNIRLDSTSRRLLAGYGDGALAVLDPDSLERLADIRLKSHPESFQLSAGNSRVYVNLPDSREIAVVDTAAARQIASWPATLRGANYPMAIDDETHSILAVFRDPASIVRYSMGDGSVTADAEACSDADDVFVDTRRNRLYVTCGAGVVDVLDRSSFRRIDRLSTSPGARTGLYDPAADLLFVAARAAGGEGAAVWVLKPLD